MGDELNFFNDLHNKTNRNYLQRMTPDKPKAMNIAMKFDADYWDGERKFGYGGYHYDGRWSQVAKNLIDKYSLTNKSKLLDVGCGKGFLLYEIKKILPQCLLTGIDSSEYALNTAHKEIKGHVRKMNAQDKYPFSSHQFDLVISFGTLHNLPIFDLKKALFEIERVAINKFIVIESFRNTAELFNLQCWALTCQSFYSPQEWRWIFNHFGYSGDYEFIFFE